jgi:crotonobetainyl-CoA:carnitine CoA-transferase CaiB-like acyl-CoA transferase
VVPFQNFPTADDWIVVACPKQELWERLCRAIGREDLMRDPAYGDMSARDRNREPLLAALSETFRTRPAADWMDLLEASGVPVGPVNGVADALMDRQVVARDGIETYHHEVLGQVRRVRSPLRLSGPARKSARAPRRGEDTARILTDVAAMSEQEAYELRSAGAFGPPEAGER